jgi:hypothetical protein
MEPLQTDVCSLSSELNSPNHESQAAAILLRYANAGIINFHETVYLEFHGAGIQAGKTLFLESQNLILSMG